MQLLGYATPDTTRHQAAQRETKALVKLRIPFELTRQAIDDVERGADDSDWSQLEDAARKIAFAEDRAVFDGYAAAGIEGVRQGTSNPVPALPADVKSYPGAVEQAVSPLRLAGVNRPYAPLLGAEAYAAVGGGSDGGYPVLQHIRHLWTERSSGPRPSRGVWRSRSVAVILHYISVRTSPSVT